MTRSSQPPRPSLIRSRRPRQPAWLRRLARGAGVVAVVLLLLALRVVTASRGELGEANRLHRQGAVDASVVHYRRAARWYAPGNPYSSSALEQLQTIGEEAETAGDRELALAAYRSIRAAILASRSFYIPESARLEHADERIAALLAAMPPPPIDADRNESQRRELHRTLLTPVARPIAPWSLLALLGFAAWVGATLGFVTRAIDDEDRIDGNAARLWGTIWILGFGAFVIGLALA